jgi:hypothetical protein
MTFAFQLKFYNLLEPLLQQVFQKISPVADFDCMYHQHFWGQDKGVLSVGWGWCPSPLETWGNMEHICRVNWNATVWVEGPQFLLPFHQQHSMFCRIDQLVGKEWHKITDPLNNYLSLTLQYGQIYSQKLVFKKWSWGWRFSSVVECLSSMWEDLGSIFSTVPPNQAQDGSTYL